MKSLTSENYIVLEVIETKLIELTAEGSDYAKNGSPEFQFVSKMAFNESCDKAEMEKRCGALVAKIGQGKAMAKKWIKQEGDKKAPIYIRIVENIVDEDQ